MKDPLKDINDKITKYEKLQEQDLNYKNKITGELNNVNIRISQRIGAIGALKELLELENLTKDAEVVKQPNNKKDANSKGKPTK